MYNSEHCYGVILAGGVGSRFWPISREDRPKQFLDFVGSGKSFLRMAFERFRGLVPHENIIVVSLDRYRNLVMEHLPELDERNLLLEPYGRNTAPALAFAAYSLLKRDPEAVMIVSPSDHLIFNFDIFSSTIESALDYASENRAIVALGIVPDRPDSNFGYVQAVDGGKAQEPGVPVKVKTFTEKPDAALAEVFYKSGEFFWNSGIFVWKASVIREELERYAPEITNLFVGWETYLGNIEEKGFLEKAYMNMERNSIDYAVMEKTEIAWMIPAKFGWADIGNWESLYGYLSLKDEDGNAVRASKKLLIDDRNNIVYSSVPRKLVVMSGMDDFVVVDTGDVLMICPRDDRKLKEVTANMGMPEFENYR